MMKLLAALSLGTVLLASPALAANVNIDGLPAAASVGGTDLLECEQSGTNRKCTAAQAAAYVYGLMGGDATAGGTGTVTFATVNSNVGSFGSATNCASITVNAKGLITAASAATCTPAVGSVTGLGTGVATALGINTGTAGSVVVNGGAGSVPQGAWTAFTAGASCGTATFTSSARWQQIAPKTTAVEYDILVTAIGTCTSGSTSVSMNLPNTSQSGGSLAGYDFTGGATVVCFIQAANTNLNCRTTAATGAVALATGSHFVLSTIYENQ